MIGIPTHRDPADFGGRRQLKDEDPVVAQDVTAAIQRTAPSSG
jgi:hypothetical protein